MFWERRVQLQAALSFRKVVGVGKCFGGVYSFSSDSAVQRTFFSVVCAGAASLGQLFSGFDSSARQRAEADLRAAGENCQAF